MINSSERFRARGPGGELSVERRPPSRRKDQPWPGHGLLPLLSAAWKGGGR